METTEPNLYLHVYPEKIGVDTTSNLNGKINLKYTDLLSFKQIIHDGEYV